MLADVVMLCELVKVLLITKDPVSLTRLPLWLIPNMPPKAFPLKEKVMVLLAGDVSFPALFVKKADETAVTPFCVYGLSLFPVAVYSAVLTFVTSDCHSAWSVYQLPYSLEKTCAFAAAETSESRAVLATMPTSRLEIRDIWSLSFGAFEGIRTHQMQVGIWWMSAAGMDSRARKQTIEVSFWSFWK